MSVQTVTLNLPSVVYKRFKHRANNNHRTIEAELLNVVSTAPATLDELPISLSTELASLALLDDNTLWDAAGSRMPIEKAELLSELHFKRDYEGLSEAESKTLNNLVRQYERYMLIRAKAAVLLKRRGQDISELGPKE
jgi:plasmid stability protein